MKKIIKNFISCFKMLFFNIKKHGNNIYIGSRVKIIGGENLILGNCVSLRPDSIIMCNDNSNLFIGNNCDIGTRSRISCAENIEIQDHVLLGPNVYIADQDHEYTDINIPIMNQGAKKFGKVFIGSGTWIGINSVIVGNVNIGKNCVIGANSVVTHDIPDYCVAVGSPARIIKKYNLEKKQWEKVK